MSLSGNVNALATRVAQEINTVRAEANGIRVLSGPTLAIDASVSENNLDTTATADVTVGVPTNPSNRQVLRLCVLASAAQRTVTFAAGYKLSTGLSSRTFTVPSGQALLAAVEYSSLLGAWTITAATVTA